MEPSEKQLVYTKVLHINPLDAHKVLGWSSLPLTPLGWAWGAWDNINDTLFTSQAVTIFYMDVGDVETVKWLQYLY